MAAILAQSGGLVRCRVSTVPGSARRDRWLTSHFRRKNQGYGLAGHFFGAETQKTLCAAVPARYNPADIGADNSVLGRGDDGRKPCRRRLGDLAFGDIDQHAVAFKRAMIFCAHDFATRKKPPHAIAWQVHPELNFQFSAWRKRLVICGAPWTDIVRMYDFVDGIWCAIEFFAVEANKGQQFVGIAHGLCGNIEMPGPHPRRFKSQRIGPRGSGFFRFLPDSLADFHNATANMAQPARFVIIAFAPVKNPEHSASNTVHQAIFDFKTRFAARNRFEGILKIGLIVGQNQL